jgi:hypothetical protein
MTTYLSPVFPETFADAILDHYYDVIISRDVGVFLEAQIRLHLSTSF